MSLDDKKAKYKALIDSYFNETGNPKDYSFKASLKRNIANIVKQLLEILIYYFAKYDEEYFHKRMDEHYIVVDKKTGNRWECHGFSYIDDFKRFHKLKFLFFHQNRPAKQVMVCVQGRQDCRDYGCPFGGQGLATITS